MPVLMEMITVADGDLNLSCNGCGVSIPDENEYESHFSQAFDGCTNGSYTGEDGYYCDDCYPRCYCRHCN